MGERRGTEKTPIIKVEIPSFSGGMNTAVNRKQIQDNEAFAITNFEFDDASDLLSRNGFVTDGTGRSSLISGVFVFSTESAFIGILNSFGASLSSRPLVLGSETDLSGGLPGGVPNNTRWYWKQLNNTAVAVMNGPTVQVNGPAPGTASALAAAPNGKYIEEWGSRLWIVHSANPNRLQCSDLGSATAWNTGGLTNPAQGIVVDVAAGDGDVISGLFAFKERLFIFKKRKIYVLRIMSLPATDPNSWEIVEYSKNIGCISQSSVREVFDDVVFLSEGGVCSLGAAEGTADFSSALISQKIEAIQRLKQNATELDIFAFTLPDKSQYWLCLQNGAHPSTEVTYVLDYKRVREGELKWVQFTRLVPTAMDAYRIDQTNIVYVFGYDGGGSNRRIGKYTANVLPVSRTYKDVDNGNNLAIEYSLLTKIYDMGFSNIRKLFLNWALAVELPNAQSVNMSVNYSIHPLAIDSSASYPTITIGHIANYDAHRIIRRALEFGTPRKGWALDLAFTINTLDDGLIIRNFILRAALLGDPVTEDRLS